MFKKFNFKKKLTKDNFVHNRIKRWQGGLDQKLVYNLNNKRIPNFRQFVKLPTVLSSLEKKILIALIFLFLISTSLWSWRFYKSHLIVLPAVGGEYTEGLVGFPAYINPILKTSDVENDLSALIFSGLIKRDKNQQLVVDLAESYELSPDQKNYTIKLRQDVLWHDGEKFNADDVIFTIESIQNPGYKSPLGVSFSSVSIKKIDDYTVKFVLEKPYAPFLNILTVGILPEHLWKNITPSNATLSSYNLEPIGTGAWKFNKLNTDNSGSVKSIELVKFDNYYGKRSYIDTLIFKFYPDFVLAIDALKNKNVEGLSYIPKKEKDKINNLKYVDFKTLNLPQYTAIFFNQANNNVLKDVNVRKALTLSTDKNLIIKEAISSEGDPIYGPILSGYVGYTQDLEKYELDLEQANKILDDNKWKKVLPEDIIKIRKEDYEKQIENIEKQIKDKKEQESTPPNQEKDKNKKEESVITLSVEELEAEKQKISNKLDQLSLLKKQEFYRQSGKDFLRIKLTTVDREENKVAVGLIKEMWSKIGAEVEIDIVDKNQIQKNVINTRQYEALLFSEAVGFDPDPYPFWHSSQNQYPGLNLAIFTHKEVDQLLEDARQIADSQNRQQKYVDFQKILVKEIPAIFLYSPTYTYPLSGKVQGFDVSRIPFPSDRFNNIEEWYVKTKGDFNLNAK